MALLFISVASGDASSAPYNPYPSFKYSGKMRPFPLSLRRELPATIRRPDYAESGVPRGEMENKRANFIQVLSPKEIEKMRLACRLGREVLEEAKKAAKVGVTCDEIDRVVHEACIARNCYPSPLNYQGFPKSCCTSVNEVICHGIPDKRPLEDGDILNIDISLYHDGYHSDLNDTIPIGNCDEKGLDLIRCARECLDAAIEAVRPGTPYRAIGDIIERHAKGKGFSVVRTYCGHGVGEFFHCAPTIPHYAKNKAVGIMKPGHVFTIEPMINEGSWQDMLWPDDWTVTTVDGKRSAQFEETLLVTETGCEILTRK